MKILQIDLGSAMKNGTVENKKIDCENVGKIKDTMCSMNFAEHLIFIKMGAFHCNFCVKLLN